MTFIQRLCGQASLGARYMIISVLGFALMGVFVKIAAAEGIPVLEIVAARALVSAVLSYLDIRRKGIPLFGYRKDLLAARGLVGALSLICVFYSISRLPFAEATVIQYLHPMFTIILAFAFLKERPTMATGICVVLSFLGLLCIAQPNFLLDHSDPVSAGMPYPILALAAAVIGAFGSATAYVLVRKLNETEDSSVIIFYFPIIAFPLSLILLGDDFVMPHGWLWLVLLLVGVCTQIGQIGLTKAMQTETAGKATSFSYLQVVFAIVFGIIFFDEIPALSVFIGAAMIIAGALINVSAQRANVNVEKAKIESAQAENTKVENSKAGSA